MAWTKFEFKIEHIIFRALLTVLDNIYYSSILKHINEAGIRWYAVNSEPAHFW